MDDRHFDNLIRSLAADRSRRGALRFLVGAATGGFAAFLHAGRGLAQETGLAPGAPCTSSSQCGQEGGAVVCADNGLVDDGGLNCCRTEGGACATGNGCCGALACVDSVCTGAGTPTTGGLPLGSACASSAECAASANGAVTCASNEIAADGVLNCCLVEGGYCGADSSLCCGDSFCVGGYCGAAVLGDLAAGDICGSTLECSQASGATTCGDNGASGDGTLRCCRLESVSCTTATQCCGGLVCGDNGIVADGALNCCAPQGGACQIDAGCCGAGYCIEGLCQG